MRSYARTSSGDAASVLQRAIAWVQDALADVNDHRPSSERERRRSTDQKAPGSSPGRKPREGRDDSHVGRH